MYKNFISSGEFAKLCDTSKETLRHYKNIGLLTPEYEADNGYLYYDPEQFYDYYAIAILKQTGTSLAKIKECMHEQNIPSVLNTLKEQQAALQQEKKKIEHMQFIVKNALFNINLGHYYDANHSEPKIDFFNHEHLLALPHDEFSISEDTKEDKGKALISILHKYKAICATHDIQTDYQLGALIPFESQSITHLYTRINRAYKHPYYYKKPAGRYLYTIHKGNCDLNQAYQSFFEFIKKHAICTTGPLYAYDLAGFMLNNVENNLMTIISIQIV